MGKTNFTDLLNIRKEKYSLLKSNLELTSEQRRLERDFWKRRKGNSFPNSYSYIYNLKKDEVEWHENLDLILSEYEDKGTTLQRINYKYHHGQRKLIEFETYSLFTKCSEFLTEDFYFFSQRAISIQNDNYWLAHQYSIPVLMDGYNRILSYLSTVFLIKKYDGEPYRSTVGLGLKNRKNKSKRVRLRNLFRAIKEEELCYFEPDNKLRIILRGSTLGLNPKEILETYREFSVKNEDEKILYDINNYRSKNLWRILIDKFPECEPIIMQNRLLMSVAYLRQMFYEFLI